MFAKPLQRKNKKLFWALSTLQWPVITPIKPTGSIKSSAAPLQSSGEQEKARCDSINQLHAELSLVTQHKQSPSSPLLSFQARAHYTEQWARADWWWHHCPLCLHGCADGSVWQNIQFTATFLRKSSSIQETLCRRETTHEWALMTPDMSQYSIKRTSFDSNLASFHVETAVFSFNRRQLLQQEEIRAQDCPCCKTVPAAAVCHSVCRQLPQDEPTEVAARFGLHRPWV